MRAEVPPMSADDHIATVKAFAALLAASDEGERNALISRAKMLAMQEASPDAFEPPIRNLGEYLEWDIPVPPVLVEPALFVRGGLTCTVARAGLGKTQMSLNRILKWSAGEPMFEGLKNKEGKGILAPVQPLRTLIIENEGAAGMFHRQLGIMLNAEGYLTEAHRALAKENVLVWGDGGWSGLKLDDEQQLSEVRAGCEKHRPDIVFIEPFRGLWRGEENSATDMAYVADALSGIASDYDCAVAICHHERKSGVGEDGERMSAGRGSTVLEGVVATMENFEKAKGGDFRELTWSKVRYGGGHLLLPVRMEWQPGDWWYRLIALDEIEQELLNELASAHPEPLTVKDLTERLGEREHTVRRTLKSLLDCDLPKIKKAASAGNGVRYRVMTPSEGSEEMDF
jgi:predicted transcriptional regulator